MTLLGLIGIVVGWALVVGWVRVLVAAARSSNSYDIIWRRSDWPISFFIVLGCSIAFVLLTWAATVRLW